MSPTMSLLFGTPLWNFEMPNRAQVNAELTQAITRLMHGDAGVTRSNRGGWQSGDTLFMQAEFKTLVDFINSRLDQVGRDYGFGSASSRLRITSMWANVNDNGSSNTLHSHQSPAGMPNPLVLSGCYYIKAPPDSGSLVLEDFGRPMRYLQLPFQEPNLVNSFTVKVPPREGNLLIFPAWMEHSVDANTSNERRISIAFNVAIIATPRTENQPAQ